MTVDLQCADVLDWARSYQGEPFHAALMDPPYNLASTRDGERGFMGARWDTAIGFRPETWAALGAHLLPGAFGMAFGGARTAHRLACAIEDAGFILHPMVVWLYGSGFPKSTRIDTQVDRAAGAKREPLGIMDSRSQYDGAVRGDMHKYTGNVWNNGEEGGSTRREVTAPSTPLAAVWAGHRYGLQAMKPAAEPIVVFQKPYVGKPVDCITRTGAGGLWIDGGRILCTDKTRFPTGYSKATGAAYAQDEYSKTWQAGEYSNPSGRWPANLCLSHLPSCRRVGNKQVKGQNGGGMNRDGQNNTVYSKHQGHTQAATVGYADASGLETVDAWECEPGCPVAALDEQAGERLSSGRYGESGGGQPSGLFGIGSIRQATYFDSGGPSRFFAVSDWSHEVQEQIEGALPFRYEAKASRSERDAGLEGMPLMLAGTFDGGPIVSEGRTAPKTGRVLAHNPHPTVKPITLTKWLATLLLPPAAYAPRRILVPFAGVGSEMIGALLAGWEDVQGIEREAEYVEIGRARLRYWQAKGLQQQLRLPELAEAGT